MALLKIADASIMADASRGQLRKPDRGKGKGDGGGLCTSRGQRRNPSRVSVSRRHGVGLAGGGTPAYGTYFRNADDAVEVAFVHCGDVPHGGTDAPMHEAVLQYGPPPSVLGRHP